MDNMIKYTKQMLDKELWAKVRVAALLSQKKLSQWIAEAVQEKLEKEKQG